MRIIIYSFVFMLVFAFGASAQSAAARERRAVMATVNQFVNGFNKGDTKSALAACADETSIIDEFAPHFWSGPGACGTWMNDYNTNAAANGIEGGIVTLTRFKHVEITATNAYVVTAANYTWKQKKKPMKETASSFTFALTKTANDGWKITAWTWGWN